MKYSGYLTDMEEVFEDSEYTKSQQTAHVRDNVLGGFYGHDDIIKNFFLVIGKLIFTNEELNGPERPELFFTINDGDEINVTIENVFENTYVYLTNIEAYTDVQLIVLASAVYEKLVLKSIKGITNNLLYNLVIVKERPNQSYLDAKYDIVKTIMELMRKSPEHGNVMMDILDDYDYHKFMQAYRDFS